MNVGQLMSQGGLAMVPLYICSVVALAVGVRKIFEFRAARLADISWIPGAIDHLRKADLVGARSHCKAVPHPAARVIEDLAATLGTRPDRAEPEAIRVGTERLAVLERHLALLAFIVQAAPLLGLLGTVLGMVDLFMGLGIGAGGKVSAHALSGGLWKALLTTAAGLMVAVPTLAAHLWLSSWVDKARATMNDVLQQALTAIPQAAWSGNSRVTRSPVNLVQPARVLGAVEATPGAGVVASD